MFMLLTPEGWSVISWFIARIIYLILCILIGCIFVGEKAKILQSAIFHIFYITIVILILTSAYTIGFSFIYSGIILLFFIVGHQVPFLVERFMSSRLDDCNRAVIYANSLYWFLYAATLILIGIMAKSPVWFLAASVWIAGAIGNAFFELTVKDSINTLDNEFSFDKKMLYSYFASKSEYPLVFIWGSFFIFFPFSLGLIGLNIIQHIYDVLISISITLAIFFAGASITISKQLTSNRERNILARLANGFSIICFCLIIISLIGWVTTNNPIIIDNGLLIPSSPVNQRFPLQLGYLTHLSLFSVAISLGIGVLLYFLILLSVSIRISKQGS